MTATPLMLVQAGSEGHQWRHGLIGVNTHTHRGSHSGPAWTRQPPHLTDPHHPPNATLAVSVSHLLITGEIEKGQSVRTVWFNLLVSLHEFCQHNEGKSTV
jgi:hypothetical protein